MYLPIPELLKEDLNTQGSTIKRYGIIVEDMDFENNIRKTLCEYRGGVFLITMQHGEVTIVKRIGIKLLTILGF